MITSPHQELIDAFSGFTKSEFHLGTGLYCNFGERIKEHVSQIHFTDGELFLRFSRLRETTQGSFLQDVFIAMWEDQQIDIIEIEVQWGRNSDTIRQIKVEKVPYVNHGESNKRVKLQFSLV